MADLQSFLIFVRYEEENERSERVVLPRRNRFEEYDEIKRGKFVPKCSKIRLAAGLRLDPLGELIRSPRLHSRNGA